MSSPILIVHGGAWTIPGDMVDGTKRGIKNALTAGYHVLKSGGTAVDGVEAAIKSLEDDPNFEAGNGSALTSAETIEMDSMIMDGKTMNAGAVGCVNCFQNPIKLAKLVMEETDHVLLVGEGANKFAEEKGVPRVKLDSLISSHARDDLKKFRKSGVFGASINTGSGSRGHDTVGAVAVDSMGNIAAGTSTGGITGKRPGRVGDTPLVGCGGYADNEVGGVSSTGHGEGIIKVCLARHVIFLMEQGLSAQDASKKALDNMKSKLKVSDGGVIVIGKKGDIGQYFTTDNMARGWIEKGTMNWGVSKDDIQSAPAI